MAVLSGCPIYQGLREACQRICSYTFQVRGVYSSVDAPTRVQTPARQVTPF